MEQLSLLERTVNTDGIANVTFNERFHRNARPGTNPVLENILAEGGEDFYSYLTWTGLIIEPDLMVLSSIQHYYYDHNDLKGIKTLINLKKLNQIKHIGSFLHTLYRILPPDACFAGCFKSSHNHCHGAAFSEPSKFIKGLIKLLDSRVENNLSKETLRSLLEENGFSVLDMTEINGMTYFCSRNNKRQWE
jgi:hypothetical protein